MEAFQEQGIDLRLLSIFADNVFLEAFREHGIDLRLLSILQTMYFWKHSQNMV